MRFTATFFENPLGLIFVCCASMSLAGCAANNEVKLFALSGKVTFQGRPIPGAEMVFHPQESGLPWMPVAVVEPDGRFVVGTKTPADGLPAGRYKVTVTWHRDATDEELGPNYLPQRYARMETTPLEVTVGPGFPEEVQWELTP